MPKRLPEPLLHRTPDLALEVAVADVAATVDEVENLVVGVVVEAAAEVVTTGEAAKATRKQKRTAQGRRMRVRSGSGLWSLMVVPTLGFEVRPNRQPYKQRRKRPSWKVERQSPSLPPVHNPFSVVEVGCPQRTLLWFPAGLFLAVAC